MVNAVKRFILDYFEGAKAEKLAEFEIVFMDLRSTQLLRKQGIVEVCITGGGFMILIPSKRC